MQASPTRRDYSAIAVQYAKDVQSGKIIACKWVKLATKRHLDDLKASKKKSFPFVYDAARARIVCLFIEKLPHVKGPKAKVPRGQRSRLIMEPWQIFIICCIFGWLVRGTPFRRFTEAYICVPRKNGKSPLAAAIGLYMLCADGEVQAEVYCGATKKEQAQEVFRPASQMAQRTPELLERFMVEVSTTSIVKNDDWSRFKAVVRKPGDGAMPSCGINDEFHEAETSIVYDTFKEGMVGREQPLLLTITTAGALIDGPCHQLQDDVQKILEGLVENDHLFAIIFTIDEGDDWTTLEALKKANPNFGVSVIEARIVAAQKQAIQFAHKQNSFKTKHLNIWVNAANPWMNMESWRKCADPDMRIEDFEGRQCWNGNDLGAKLDLASSAYLFLRELPTGPDGEIERHYYYFGKHYVPKATAFDGEHQQYEKWVHEGHIIPHEGAEIRLSRVKAGLERDAQRFKMEAMAFDPWQALQMQQDLEQVFGEDVVASIDQITKNLSDSMKEVQAAVYAGRFHHDGDPVMAWAMSNVVVEEDRNDNVFPRKEKKGGRKKIDPVSALLTAMNRAYHAPVEPESVYETRGILEL